MRTFNVPVSKVVPGDIVVSGVARYEVNDVEVFLDQCIIHANGNSAALFYSPTDSVSVLARSYETAGEWIMLCVFTVTAVLFISGII